MTLDELISVLTKVRDDGNIPGYNKGNFKVYVQCQIPDLDGWLVPQNIKIAHGDNESTFVRIEGGFGA